MKHYTSKDQTAKLIELGFKRPKMAAPALKWVDGEPTFEPQYTIGELIEMLPPHIGRWELDIFHNLHFACWTVCIDPEKYTTAATELIDALYDMVVKLKEEGVI